MSSEFILPLLIVAVGIGAFLNMFSIVLNIITHAKDDNKGECLFSQNGVAGLVFYGALVIGAGFTAVGISVFSPLYILLLIVVPLLLDVYKRQYHGSLYCRIDHFRNESFFLCEDAYRNFKLSAYFTGFLC